MERCLSKPRAGLPSWQREPNLPSCTLPSPRCKLSGSGSQGNTTALGALSCYGPLTGSTIFATENCMFAGHLLQQASALEIFFFSRTTCRVACQLGGQWTPASLQCPVLTFPPTASPNPAQNMAQERLCDDRRHHCSQLRTLLCAFSPPFFSSAKLS